jgi:hypothetical protein
MSKNNPPEGVEYKEFVRILSKGRLADRGIRFVASIDFVHGAIGMSTEIAEVYDLFVYGVCKDTEHLKEEIGDCCWYFQLMLEHFDTRISDLHSPQSIDDGTNFGNEMSYLICKTGQVLDCAKANVFYDTGLIRAVIFDALKDVINSLDRIAQLHGFTLHDAIASNIAKLRKRYPEGFNEAAANERIDKDPSIDDVTRRQS